jgi:AraC family transcriptional regulator, regulatory protein of adaptative response / methylated-DNA-[protein]-cysteine methyltransferase
MSWSSEDYSRIEKAIHYLDRSFPERPSLAEVAGSVNLSEFHFQRMFRRWAGISPKQLLQYLTLDYAKRALADSQSVLEASYSAGLSSPGRLHDLFVSMEAVTPGEFKSRGAGLEIRYGYHATPFGECLLAATDRGICNLLFVLQGDRSKTLREVREKWPGATLIEKPQATRGYIERIFGEPNQSNGARLPVFLKGTNFQIKVWEALLTIPSGSVVAYEELAIRAGNSKATRAVGTAVGQNPVAFLIPCHRVIRKIGAFGGYHGGVERKRAMLAWEAARAQNSIDAA